jgi:hypothetical protein
MDAVNINNVWSDCREASAKTCRLRNQLQRNRPKNLASPCVGGTLPNLGQKMIQGTAAKAVQGNMATSSLKKVSFPNSPDTLRGVSLKTNAAFTDICIFSYVLFVLSLVSFRPFLLFFFLFSLSSLCL